MPVKVATSCDASLPQQIDTKAGIDAWLLQKLRMEWSSHELGGLLTPSKLAEARASFMHLETPIKIRLLLSLISTRLNEANGAALKTEVDSLLQLSDEDAEEWVKVSTGIVKQFLLLKCNGQSTDSYLHAQLEATSSKVVQAVAFSFKKHLRNSMSNVVVDDTFSLENGLLNSSLCPQSAPSAAVHFTVIGEDEDANAKEDDVAASPVKKSLHRPLMARPAGALASSSTSSSLASSRMTSASKLSVGKTKNLMEMSSEIRRKADAGRFKRQRSRISMIDINEVKQIESEKAHKAEERKKQKLAAKEKEKEEKAKEKEKEKSGAAVANLVTNAGDKAGAVTGFVAPIGANDEHVALAADIFAMHYQSGLDESIPQYTQQQQLHSEAMTEVGDQNLSGDKYVPDGTQALLNAAFHSTQDIMKEVVTQQNHQLSDNQLLQQQQMPQSLYQDLYRSQQPMHMHHLVSPQQQYHQGFETEDATLNSTNTAGMPMPFSSYNNYSNTNGFFGDQFGNYGNSFGSIGFANAPMGQQDNSMGLPPLGGRQLSFDPTQPQHPQQQQQNNGAFMGGPGEYWR
ncbi:hypothetical protein CCR75_007070 [Bremia lactucae]|uniref:Negative elongation factor A n=1 Tax=Bremia lactucae TaxID=4779 RepID=A0A976IKW8_BRELC|nr:hypothetical protein CCR75_007070 [Bremia lactucae]